MSNCFVLDACALLRLALDEPGADTVEQYLRKAQAGQLQLLMHIINLGEMTYLIGKKSGWNVADRKRSELSLLPIKVIEFSENLFWQAVQIKSQYPMSYADCFAAALALERGAVLLSSDPEFSVLDSKIKRISI